MTGKQRQKSATRVDATTKIARKRRLAKPRKQVMAAYQASHARFGKLYKKPTE